MVGLDDLKAKINRFYPKKIVLSPIREDVLLYISLLNLITSLFPIVTLFSFLFLDPPPQCIIFLLYCLPSFISTLHG